MIYVSWIYACPRNKSNPDQVLRLGITSKKWHLSDEYYVTLIHAPLKLSFGENFVSRCEDFIPLLDLPPLFTTWDSHLNRLGQIYNYSDSMVKPPLNPLTTSPTQGLPTRQKNQAQSAHSPISLQHPSSTVCDTKLETLSKKCSADQASCKGCSKSYIRTFMQYTNENKPWENEYAHLKGMAIRKFERMKSFDFKLALIISIIPSMIMTWCICRLMWSYFKVNAGIVLKFKLKGEYFDHHDGWRLIPMLDDWINIHYFYEIKRMIPFFILSFISITILVYQSLRISRKKRFFITEPV